MFFKRQGISSFWVGDKRTLENEIENTKNLLSGLNEQLEKKIIELTGYQDYQAAVYGEAFDKYLELTRRENLNQIQENYNRQKAVYDNRAARLINGEKNFIGLYQM